jgi:hypothetical protein
VFQLKSLIFWALWIFTIGFNWLLGDIVLYTSGISRAYFPSAQTNIISDFLQGVLIWGIPSGGQAFLLYGNYSCKKLGALWWAVLSALGWSAFWMIYDIAVVSDKHLLVGLGFLGVGIIQTVVLRFALKVQANRLLWWLLFHMAYGVSYWIFFPDLLAEFLLLLGVYAIMNGYLILMIIRRPQN